jgi:4-diphosphocytidyl-2-C-methyl-D-erythritol kinase
VNAGWWPAPAKLNLFLHVLGRRPDGYHDLQTVFQLVSLADQLRFTPLEGGRIELQVTPRASWPSDQDLVCRAARALQRASGVQGGAAIELRKVIPAGGGLGGGSSDAATTLLVLNKIWETELKIDDLAAIGAELGSDVPLFLHGVSAWAEGRGERLTPIELPRSWYLIVYPGVALATRELFQAPELTRNSPLITIPGFLREGGRNDFEPVVRARYPAVADALEWLARFAPAKLTGTGSCVFAAFGSAAEAESVAARVPDAWQSFVAQGLARSPLHARL